MSTLQELVISNVDNIVGRCIIFGGILLYSFILDFIRNIVKNKILRVDQKSSSCQIFINISFTLFCLPIFVAPFLFIFFVQFSNGFLIPFSAEFLPKFPKNKTISK